jgi:hypothetical protein
LAVVSGPVYGGGASNFLIQPWIHKKGIDIKRYVRLIAVLLNSAGQVNRKIQSHSIEIFWRELINVFRVGIKPQLFISTRNNVFFVQEIIDTDIDQYRFLFF